MASVSINRLRRVPPQPRTSAAGLRALPAVVLFAAVLSAACAPGCARDVAAVPSAGPVAIINGDPLSQDTLASAFRERLELGLSPSPPAGNESESGAPSQSLVDATAPKNPADHPQSRPANPAQRRKLLRAVLDDLINRRLLLAEARRLRIIPSDEAVDALFEQLKLNYEGEEEFEKALLDRGLTPDQLRARLRDDRQIGELFTREAHLRVAVDDLELRRVYDANPAAWETGESVRARILVLRDEKTAKKLLGRLKAGESFEALARAYSISPEAGEGGRLPDFERGEMPQVFEDAGFSQKEGDLSDIIKTEFGFVIFKVEKRFKGRKLSFAEAAPRIEARLLEEKRRAAEQALVKRLTEAARITIDEGVLAALLDRFAGVSPDAGKR